MFFYAKGNAKILVYDENKENIVRVLENNRGRRETIQ